MLAMKIRRWILIFLITLGLLSLAEVAVAQITVGEGEVEYTFGENLSIRTSLESDEAIREAWIFFQVDGEAKTDVQPAQIVAMGEGAYQLRYTHDLSSQPLRPFSNVSYHFEVKTEGGETVSGPTESFPYEDNRTDWQVLGEPPFTVHWYSGDIVFAQAVLDVAQAGLERVQYLQPVTTPRNVDIYVYPTARELQSSLELAGLDWVAGHADPDLGVMVVSIPATPEQKILMEQRIPHELMHILLYQEHGAGYAKLPTWLSEGLASISELYPNPDYVILLNDAYSRQALFPIENLCQPFPRDASNALLAYAQAASFAQYLSDQYGASGLQALVQRYADGMDCQRGAEAALGVSLLQLERGWRQATFGENVVQAAFVNMLPWMVLLALPLAATFLAGLGRSRKRAGARQNVPEA
jgi:hypothetical protein